MVVSRALCTSCTAFSLKARLLFTGFLLVCVQLVIAHMVHCLCRRLLLGLLHIRSEGGQFLVVSDCLITARSFVNWALDGSAAGWDIVGITLPVLELDLEAMRIVKNNMAEGQIVSQVHKAARNGTTTAWMALIYTSTSFSLRNIRECIFCTSNDRKIYRYVCLIGLKF